MTLEKAIDSTHGTEGMAVQMKITSVESGLSAVEEKELSENVPAVSSAGSRTVDLVVGTMKDAAALPLVRSTRIIKRGINLLPSVLQKARCLLSKSDFI